MIIILLFGKKLKVITFVKFLALLIFLKLCLLYTSCVFIEEKKHLEYNVHDKLKNQHIKNNEINTTFLENFNLFCYCNSYCHIHKDINKYRYPNVLKKHIFYRMIFFLKNLKKNNFSYNNMLHNNNSFIQKDVNLLPNSLSSFFYKYPYYDFLYNYYLNRHYPIYSFNSDSMQYILPNHLKINVVLKHYRNKNHLCNGKICKQDAITKSLDQVFFKVPRSSRKDFYLQIKPKSIVNQSTLTSILFRFSSFLNHFFYNYFSFLKFSHALNLLSDNQKHSNLIARDLSYKSTPLLTSTFSLHSKFSYPCMLSSTKNFSSSFLELGLSPNCLMANCRNGKLLKRENNENSCFTRTKCNDCYKIIDQDLCSTLHFEKNNVVLYRSQLFTSVENKISFPQPETKNDVEPKYTSDETSQNYNNYFEENDEDTSYIQLDIKSKSGKKLEDESNVTISNAMDIPISKHFDAKSKNKTIPPLWLSKTSSFFLSFLHDKTVSYDQIENEGNYNLINNDGSESLTDSVQVKSAISGTLAKKETSIWKIQGGLSRQPDLINKCFVTPSKKVILRIRVAIRYKNPFRPKQEEGQKNDNPEQEEDQKNDNPEPEEYNEQESYIETHQRILKEKSGQKSMTKERVMNKNDYIQKTGSANKVVEEGQSFLEEFEKISDDENEKYSYETDNDNEKSKKSKFFGFFKRNKENEPKNQEDEEEEKNEPEKKKSKQKNKTFKNVLSYIKKIKTKGIFYKDPKFLSNMFQLQVHFSSSILDICHLPAVYKKNKMKDNEMYITQFEIPVLVSNFKNNGDFENFIKDGLKVLYVCESSEGCFLTEKYLSCVVVTCKESQKHLEDLEKSDSSYKENKIKQLKNQRKKKEFLAKDERKLIFKKFEEEKLQKAKENLEKLEKELQRKKNLEKLENELQGKENNNKNFAQNIMSTDQFTGMPKNPYELIHSNIINRGLSEALPLLEVNKKDKNNIISEKNKITIVLPTSNRARALIPFSNGVPDFILFFFYVKFSLLFSLGLFF